MPDEQQPQPREPRARVDDAVVQRARDLRERHGYTFRQVADIVQQPYETVRKWLRYTRRPFTNRPRP